MYTLRTIDRLNGNFESNYYLGENYSVSKDLFEEEDNGLTVVMVVMSGIGKDHEIREKDDAYIVLSDGSTFQCLRKSTFISIETEKESRFISK